MQTVPMEISTGDYHTSQGAQKVYLLYILSQLLPGEMNGYFVNVRVPKMVQSSFDNSFYQALQNQLTVSLI